MADTVANIDDSQAHSVRFQLTDPEVAKDPGEFFADLRSKCPVAHSDSFDGFWTLSRYKDVFDAALKPQAFSSASGVTIPVVPQPQVLCIEQDDPEHRKYRKPLQGWFTAKRMQEIEPSVRQIVTTLLDEIVDDKKGDLAGIAAAVPAMVIALILGLPEKDWDWFREREATTLRLAQTGDKEGAGAAANDVLNYLSATIEERRVNPQEDMLSDLAALAIDGQVISHQEAVSLAFLLLGAGHETTVGGIGGLLYRVFQNPDVRDQLIDDPTLVVAAVEEALRVETPLFGLGRMVTQDSTVDEVNIPAGDRVMLMWGSANRDPDVFEDPETFRLDRDNSEKHIAFGAGIHRCVGAPLARLEMRVVLEEILQRMPNLRLTSPDDVNVIWTVGREFQGLHSTW
ncbi:cytochrome P450 [Rhodococcus wratislaviensis]|uniref:Putative cytochrome P450 n=1 Tax=Rhodococcus wratislaviensis NBRC 100605 TaxID=1219028 RepID=X0PW03_RHOWR|nr:cytochrome P450 [Rhodococcus wratislaviensis]GAF47459.1 putative cytochrome P450 [Rhodococcus wratislaviensis NBRC 100605]